MQNLTLNLCSLERLSDAAKAGLRELLVSKSMTDTDLSQYLQTQGFGRYENFCSSLSSKTSFLDRNFGGYNSIKTAFKPTLTNLLAPNQLG
ncbi:hypothetical protein MYX04_06165 [Nitrospiraceae bacterium AH_259_D15_M11_P09]|nr:hypothetical protein [Nitrospiraceae bacterium AH_259_D15_M11_P09]